jgi:tripartite-type tricarboxylate transporter receptor subunit TctC
LRAQFYVSDIACGASWFGKFTWQIAGVRSSTTKGDVMFYCRYWLIVAGCLLYSITAAESDAVRSYPTKPIRIVVPAPAGGGSDIIARRIGQALSEAWGQPVVVDNKPGANGAIAAEFVAKAAPDGYTLLIGHNGIFSINPHVMAKLPYDPINNFTPITQTTFAPTIIVANSNLPVTSLKELIALCKSKPGQITYGSPGTGSPAHLAGELFRKHADVDIVHVPYKGSAPMVADLAGGQIPFAFDFVISSRPLIEAGRLRALAIMGSKRAPILPDVPTTAEAGYADLLYHAWVGFFAPAGTAPEIVNKLKDEIVKGLHRKEYLELSRENGAQIVGSSPENFAAYIKTDIAAVGALIKAAGIKLE